MKSLIAHPSPRPKTGPITVNDTKNLLRGCWGVVFLGSARTRNDTGGRVTASIVHLFGMDTTTQITPTFLTQRELGELLRLPERTLEDWRLTQSGPPYLKLGRHVYSLTRSGASAAAHRCPVCAIGPGLHEALRFL